jgi:mannitol/fructose-specific phosphotransferase system IIA component (Ntr-type)
VRLFFLIVAPPVDRNNEYLPLLGQIAELVKDAPVREKLLEAQNYADLREILEGGRG